MSKKLIDKSVEELDVDMFEIHIDDVIDFLVKARDNGAKLLDFYAHAMDYDRKESLTIDAYFQREETDDEYEKRMKEEADIKSQREKLVIEQKKREFYRLKKELEGHL